MDAPCDGLWLAHGTRFIDVEETALTIGAMRIGAKTFGAIGLTELRELPADLYLKVVEEHNATNDPVEADPNE